MRKPRRAFTAGGEQEAHRQEAAERRIPAPTAGGGSPPAAELLEARAGRMQTLTGAGDGA